jgi:hypothetical protein
MGLISTIFDATNTTLNGLGQLTGSLEGLATAAGVLEPAFALAEMQWGLKFPVQIAFSKNLKVIKDLKNAVWSIFTSSDFINKSYGTKDFNSIESMARSGKRICFMVASFLYYRDYLKGLSGIAVSAADTMLKIKLVFAGTVCATIENICKISRYNGKISRLEHRAKIFAGAAAADAAMCNALAAKIAARTAKLQALAPGRALTGFKSKVVNTNPDAGNYIDLKGKAQMLKLLVKAGRGKRSKKSADYREALAIDNMNGPQYAAHTLKRYAVRQVNLNTIKTKEDLALLGNLLKLPILGLMIWKAPAAAFIPIDYEEAFEKGKELLSLAAGSLKLWKFLYDANNKELLAEPRAAAAA